ncbi:MAG: hypothetical protein P8X48_03320 [Acidiferrobacteraceae bacterium]|jgi:hypothetical protein
MERNSRAGRFAARFASSTIGALLCALAVAPITYADASVAIGADPHYTRAGFFDMHVCDWTDRPLFFLVVFSTERYAEVKSVDVIRPNGKPLVKMDLSRYRIIKRKNKPEKRAFINKLPLPRDATDGWYSARIALRNGKHYVAKDFVVIYPIPPATGLTPRNGVENIPVPSVLKWNPVPGAKYYKVYIKDEWEGDRLIYKSKLLTKPRLDLPPGILKPGGLYSWRVHARDVNENVLLGDFNHGSFTGETEFSTAE